MQKVLAPSISALSFPILHTKKKTKKNRTYFFLGASGVTQPSLVLGSNCKTRKGYANAVALKFYSCTIGVKGAMRGNAVKNSRLPGVGVDVNKLS